jgi:diguanylate cyclase (GGDEF)-like protein
MNLDIVKLQVPVRHKILIVDDTLANIEILYKILQGDYEIFFAKNGQDGLKVVKRELPDLILLDIMMPEMDGYQVCAKLKADPHTAGIPVIFITAMGSDEDQTKGLDYGAIDYLTKPISPPIVRARVRNHLELKRSRDALEALGRELTDKNLELKRLAREDGLTGLANRRHFNEMLEAEIKRAFRTRQYLSLIICDVDYFKRYNDHFGHPAGDRCLQMIGATLLSTFMRAGDVPARYGGEEFAVILPETSPESVVQLAEKLRRKMVAQAIPHPGSDALDVVTLSLGVVGAQVTKERNAEWFLDAADQALYQSKKQGRNRVTAAQVEQGTISHAATEQAEKPENTSHGVTEPHGETRSLPPRRHGAHRETRPVPTGK